MLLLATISALALIVEADQANGDEGGGFSSCIPDTYEDALDCLGAVLNDENKARLLGYRHSDLVSLHRGFGAGLRNAWLWGYRSQAAIDMTERGFQHPDDMSSAIITGYWARENGCDYPIEPVIAWFTAWWEASAAARTRPGGNEVGPRPVPECPFDLSKHPPGREPMVVEY